MMKKTFFLWVLMSLLISPLFAQQTPSPRYHELGIVFSDLNAFGLRYKYGGEKTMLRVSLLALNLDALHSSYTQPGNHATDQTGYGAGFRMGVDHRIPIVKSFSLLIGGELGLNYSSQHQKDSNNSGSIEQDTWMVAPGVNFVFGLNYVLKEHLVFGAEIDPGVAYSYIEVNYKTTGYKTITKDILFNISTAGAGLSIAYRFGK